LKLKKIKAETPMAEPKKDYDLDKLARAVAMHETADCTK